MPHPEVTPAMFEVAERQVAEIRKLGIECTVDEIIMASHVSNLIETATTVNQDLSTEATRMLGHGRGMAHCIELARAIDGIRRAESADQQASALVEHLLPVIADLTASKAKSLSKLGRH